MKFEGIFKIPYFSAKIKNPTVLKNGHSGADFKNDEFVGFYADVEFKNDGLVDSITFRLEDESSPDFSGKETYTQALNNWISAQVEKLKIE